MTGAGTLVVVSDKAVLRQDLVKCLSFGNVVVEALSEVLSKDNALEVAFPVVVVKELSLETVNSSLPVDVDVASWVGSWAVVLCMVVGPLGIKKNFHNMHISKH